MKSITIFAVLCVLTISTSYSQNIDNLLLIKEESITPSSLELLDPDSKESIYQFLGANTSSLPTQMNKEELKDNTILFMYRGFTVNERYRALNNICEKVDVESKKDACGNETVARHTEDVLFLKDEVVDQIPAGSKFADKFAAFKEINWEDNYGTQILRKERGANGNDWTTYLEGSKATYVCILLEDLAEIKQFKFEIELQESRFVSSLKAMIEIGKDTKGPSKAGGKPGIMLIYRVDPKKLTIPAKLDVSYPKNTDGEETEELNLIIHERSWVEFKAGYAMSTIDKKLFTLNDDTLTITPDSATKVEIRNNLILGLELSLPRDIDRMTPIWKNPLKRPYERLGLYLGARVNSIKMTGIFLGGSLALTRDFSIMAGATWQRNFANDTTSVAENSSLKEAQQEAPKTWNKAKFFWGIALSPSMLLKAIKD